MSKKQRRLLITALVILMIGGALFTIGRKMGGEFVGLSYSDGSWQYEQLTTDKAYEVESYTYTCKDEVNAVVFTTSLGNVELKPSSNGTTYVEIREMYKGVTTITEQNGTLSVATNYKNNFSLSENYENTIVVYLNEDSIDKLDLDLSMSNFNGTISNAQSVSMNLSMANVVCNDMSATVLDIEADMSNVDYEGEAQNVTLSTSMGDIDLNLKGNLEDYGYTIDCNMGDVKLNDKDYSSIEKEYTQLSPTGKTIQIKCDMGSVEVEIGK